MNAEPSHSNAIAIPPMIFAIAFGAGLALDSVWLDTLWPGDAFPLAVRVGAGAALIALGVLLVAVTAPLFLKHGTSIHVHRPSTTLIREGPYKYSRNPAYVALILVYVGTAIAVDSPGALAMGLPAVLVLHYGVVRREERYLLRTFGSEYEAYSARVRRWL